MKVEKIEGRTPNGGVRSEILYMNDNNELVDKKEATRAVIRELDENDKIIFETWGYLDN